MKKHRLKGIILKQIEYSENSLVLRYLSREHGLISILAKGVRKQAEKIQFTNLQEYDMGLSEPKESGLWLYNDHDLLANYSTYPNPATWAAAECGMELISQMIISSDEHAHIYDLAISYLEYLNQVNTNAILIFWRFFIRMLRIGGVGAPQDFCCVCHQSLDSYDVIDLQHGGLLCHACRQDNSNHENQQKLSELSSQVLRWIPEIGNHLGEIKLSRREVGEINLLLERYWDRHNKQTLKLKSLSVLGQFYA